MLTIIQSPESTVRYFQSQWAGAAWDAVIRYRLGGVASSTTVVSAGGGSWQEEMQRLNAQLTEHDVIFLEVEWKDSADMAGEYLRRSLLPGTWFTRAASSYTLTAEVTAHTLHGTYSGTTSVQLWRERGRWRISATDFLPMYASESLSTVSSPGLLEAYVIRMQPSQVQNWAAVLEYFQLLPGWEKKFIRSHGFRIFPGDLASIVWVTTVPPDTSWMQIAGLTVEQTTVSSEPDYDLPVDLLQ